MRRLTQARVLLPALALLVLLALLTLFERGYRRLREAILKKADATIANMERKSFSLVRGSYLRTPLLALLDTAARQGFMREQHVGLMLADSDADTLLARMRAYQPASAHKWLDRAAC